MNDSHSNPEAPRRAQVDAILDRDGSPLGASPHGEGPRRGPSFTAGAQSFAFGSGFRPKVFIATGLPGPVKFLLAFLIPAFLVAALALIVFFLIGLFAMRVLGGFLGLLGFSAPRRAYRDPLDLIRSR